MWGRATIGGFAPIHRFDRSPPPPSPPLRAIDPRPTPTGGHRRFPPDPPPFRATRHPGRATPKRAAQASSGPSMARARRPECWIDPHPHPRSAPNRLTHGPTRLPTPRESPTSPPRFRGPPPSAPQRPLPPHRHPPDGPSGRRRWHRGDDRRPGRGDVAPRGRSRLRRAPRRSDGPPTAHPITETVGVTYPAPAPSPPTAGCPIRRTTLAQERRSRAGGMWVATPRRSRLLRHSTRSAGHRRDDGSA